MIRQLRLAFGVVLGMLLAHSASASSITVGSGDSFSVNFNGIVDESVQAGLTASATFNIDSITYSSGTTTWNLSIELANTSSNPIDASRVSTLGFNTDPNIIGASITPGIFDTVSSGNVPQIGTVEVCLTDVNCAGGGGSGVNLGSVATLMATLTFNGTVNEVTFDNFAVRYQSIVGAAAGDSGSGFGTVVPLPASVWLFLSALAGLAAIRRFRPSSLAAALEPDRGARYA